MDYPKALSSQARVASQVGKTIIEQMGGLARLVRFIGARDFKLFPQGMEFKWPNRQVSRGNVFRVTLTPSDLYTVEFFSDTARGRKLVKKMTDVYSENLVDVFEDHTHWYLRMASAQHKMACRVAESWLSHQSKR